MTVQGTKLLMTRGDTESITVRKKSGAFSSGDTVCFTVRPSYDEPIVLQKAVTEFPDGQAVIQILPGDTSGLSVGKYVYDVQWTDAGGAVTTIVKPRLNNFVLEPEVTY